MNTNATRLLLLTIVLYIVALTSGLRLLYYVSYVLGAVLICSWIWARLNLSALDIRREARRLQTQVGDTFEETFLVRNDSRIPKLWVEVRDHSTLPGHQAAAVISLQGHRSKRWRVRTITRRRGLYQLGPLTAISGEAARSFRNPEWVAITLNAFVNFGLGAVLIELLRAEGLAPSQAIAFGSMLGVIQVSARRSPAPPPRRSRIQTQVSGASASRAPTARMAALGPRS